ELIDPGPVVMDDSDRADRDLTEAPAVGLAPAAEMTGEAARHAGRGLALARLRGAGRVAVDHAALDIDVPAGERRGPAQPADRARPGAGVEADEDEAAEVACPRRRPRGTQEAGDFVTSEPALAGRRASRQGNGGGARQVPLAHAPF